MDLQSVVRDILTPAAELLPPRLDSFEARVMLLTIGQQESRFQYRRQMGDGPARGFWQFERGGGVKGILNHQATRGPLHMVCAARDVTFEITPIWATLETDDILAACCARLLLLSDPKALPAVHDVDGAWNLYALRTWRPGKPHRETWDGYHLASRRALGIVS